MKTTFVFIFTPISAPVILLLLWSVLSIRHPERAQASVVQGYVSASSLAVEGSDLDSVLDTRTRGLKVVQ